MTDQERDRWLADRERQSKQHPTDQALARLGVSRGEFYRRKNNGIAYRTFAAIAHPSGPLFSTVRKDSK